MAVKCSTVVSGTESVISAVPLAATQNVDHFKRTLTQFYKEFGVGKLGLHKAFRVEHPENSDVEIIPITNIAHVHLDDLVGYEDAKKKAG